MWCIKYTYGINTVKSIELGITINIYYDLMKTIDLILSSVAILPAILDFAGCPGIDISIMNSEMHLLCLNE